MYLLVRADRFPVRRKWPQAWGGGPFFVTKDWDQGRTGGGVQPPPPEIPKALQNRAKLNPIVKTVKNC